MCKDNIFVGNVILRQSAVQPFGGAEGLRFVPEPYAHTLGTELSSIHMAAEMSFTCSR